MTWDDIVIEALCWDWIDGIENSIDEHVYLQRITPKKARSNWSKRNSKHAQRLISEGRMRPQRLAKEDGRWDNASTASNMNVPEDFLLALKDKPKAKLFLELSKNRAVILLHMT